MLKIRDFNSGNNKDKNGDNTSAINPSNSHHFNLLNSSLNSSLISSSFSSKINTFCPILNTCSFTVLITSSCTRNFSTKIRNSFSLSFYRFTKCVIINPVIVIINSTT